MKLLPTEPTDDALVAAANAGDETAFERLFERHRRRVARIAGRFFSRREEIEEIVQDSFTKVYFALGDYSGAHGSSFTAWLTRIAINTCYDALRRIRRRKLALTNIDEDETRELAAQFRAANASNDLERALISHDLAVKLLARLSPEDRLILTLLDAEGFSVAEISEFTGWSASKVKVRAHRARKHLRGVLQRLL